MTIDSGRIATGGGKSRETPNEKAEAAKPVQIIERAVVIDTLNDLSVRDDKVLSAIASSVSNPEDLAIAPRGSIVARLCRAGKGRSGALDIICFPFFSSHFSLPLKTGEQAWIIRETPANPEKRGWWLSRIHEPLQAEDPNYTHGDRRNDPTNPDEAAEDDKDGAPIEQKQPSFPNGPDRFETDPDNFTLSGKDTFEKICEDTKECMSFVIEPVPRFTKRPGDLVLQGSHNAAIILGTSRGYDKNATIDNDKSSAHEADGLKPGMGAIDIVVGRGALKPDETKALSGEDDPSKGKKPKRTEPQVAMNTRGTFETNKNINMLDDKKTNTRTNASEGDPDYYMDASRVCLTVNSKGDSDLNLNYPSFAGSSAGPAPYVLAKSQEIRIVARQEGSVRIIKEGAAGGNQCVITMLADGTVAIDAEKIIIGDGRDEQVYIGNGATEPIFKGKELEAALHDLAFFLIKPIGNMGSPLIGALGEMEKFQNAVTAALSAVSFTK